MHIYGDGNFAFSTGYTPGTILPDPERIQSAVRVSISQPDNFSPGISNNPSGQESENLYTYLYKYEGNALGVILT